MTNNDMRIRAALADIEHDLGRQLTSDAFVIGSAAVCLVGADIDVADWRCVWRTRGNPCASMSRAPWMGTPRVFACLHRRNCDACSICSVGIKTVAVRLSFEACSFACRRQACSNDSTYDGHG